MCDHSISIWNISACWTRNGCCISSTWLILILSLAYMFIGSCSLLKISKTIQFLFIHPHPHQTKKNKKNGETFFNSAGGLNISTSLIFLWLILNPKMWRCNNDSSLESLQIYTGQGHSWLCQLVCLSLFFSRIFVLIRYWTRSVWSDSWFPLDVNEFISFFSRLKTAQTLKNVWNMRREKGQKSRDRRRESVDYMCIEARPTLINIPYIEREKTSVTTTTTTTSRGGSWLPSLIDPHCWIITMADWLCQFTLLRDARATGIRV